MNYQISFSENPPEARLTVDGKEGCVMLSRSIPITESTTTAELHEVGLSLVMEQEQAFADYDAEQAVASAKAAKVKEMQIAFEDSVEVTSKEIEEKKAEIVAVEEAKLQAIEDARIAKEAAEAEAVALAKEEVVETPVEKVVLEEPVI